MPMKGHQPRIIAGTWRGRRLPVLSLEGLRPTPDRIRETVFNWLATDCRNARVLDCCAGSGAMLFEAISRGAAAAVAIEKHKAAAHSLLQMADTLETDKVTVLQGDVLQKIPLLEGTFDLVFIDPPYAQADLRSRCFALLESHRVLTPGALIYYEWPSGSEFELPSGQLSWYRRKKAGQVEFGVAQWQATG